MSVTSGFFNSFEGDRKYDAEQMSSIFDGLIIDGIFASIGTAFAVKAAGGLTVNVGVGKAWFDHTWTLNDAVLVLTAPDSETLLDRIDAIVIEVNHKDAVRQNSIKFVTGTPSSSPVRPTMESDYNIHQHPLCYISRKAASTEIAQADITSMIGTESAPFVTGILQTVSLDELLGQWQDELNRYTAARKQDVDIWMSDTQTEVDAKFAQIKADLESEYAVLSEWVTSQQADFTAWFNETKGQTSALIESEESTFLTWFDKMKGQLSEDAAGKLQVQIDKEAIRRTFLCGLEDGMKEFSEDGLIITSTASDGRKLIKTFSSDFLTMTAVLTNESGLKAAQCVKTFDEDGKLINTVITYY